MQAESYSNPLIVSPVASFQPVAQADRIETVDILRGIALLGILMMNIPAFAMPEYFSKSFRSDTSNINFWVDAVVTVLFEGKMRALFSMIFGVGILLFTTKKERTGKSVVGLYYRRMGWLILFGLVDAHLLLWFGDILYLYGVCGLLAFLFRKVKPAYLAIGVPLVALIDFTSGTFFYQNMREKLLGYKEAKAAQDHHQTLTEQQKKAMTDWRAIQKEFLPNKAEVAEHTRSMKSDYTTVAKYLRPLSWDFQTKYLAYAVWDPLALMLLGMALFKWGYFAGKWPRRRYVQIMLVGYGIGLPLVIFNYYNSFIHFPNVAARLAYMETHAISWMSLIYPFQRILLVMAHASLIIMLISSGVAQSFLKRLAAVGQMAFTNYVMHTVICTFIFFGYGLNYFAELQYYQLFFIVAGIWVLQLIVSPIWLKHFQFGPLEWCWRSLTYWQRQPLRQQESRQNA
jgi:uncharacterized protein